MTKQGKSGARGPGRSHREGLGLRELIRMFPDDETARAWFESKLWPSGPFCPHCGSTSEQADIKHKTMTHRCRDCPDKRMFSVRVGSVMEGSKLGYQTWAIAIYLTVTSLKSVSSMKLHRDLGVTQKTAWYLMHRLRKAFEEGRLAPFAGPTEVDETYVGGRKKRGTPGRGVKGKAVVAGAKDRVTKKVRAEAIPNTRKGTLQRFVVAHAEIGSLVYTDDHRSYLDMPWHHHEAVQHSVGEYVRGQINTNGIESFWSVLKRAHKGVFHKLSPKHLDRYVQEFAGKHNARESNTIEQMGQLAAGMAGKRLSYEDLIADNGLASFARA
ncbi:MAG: IS1595 family transposase [Chloroflexi bacterium]|nr:IS1595 family transposase [Chloroflexota bacterium]